MLKRVRTRLAKAELRMGLAQQAEEWAKTLERAGTGEGSARYPSIEEWPADDEFRVLMRTYDLTAEDLCKILRSLAEDLEYHAIRTGYDETWEAAP